MSTTFQLRELKGAATGHYRLDSAELTSSAVAGLPLVSVQGGAALGSVQAPGGDTVLWAKLLGFGGVPVAGVPAVRLVADQPSVALAPNTDSAAAAQAAAIAAAATDATSKVAAEATARTSAISAAITALVNGAPGALDTLNELAVALTADEGAATTLATLVGTKMPVVVHGSTASTARPTSSVPVLWLGSVTPTNAVANDLLVDTATPAFKVRGASAFTLVGGTSVALADRGNWTTTTAYVVGDVVTQSAVRYICETAHTAGTFATDLAASKWVALDLPSLQTALNLSDLASAATARTNLGLGTSAVKDAGAAAGNVLLLGAGAPSGGFVLSWDVASGSYKPLAQSLTSSQGATPDALTGSPTIIGYFKASSIGLADGAAVGSWTDSGPNGNTVTQATAGNKPTYKVAASVPWFNGNPAVRFDGTDDFLSKTSGLTVTALTSFTIATLCFFPSSLTSGTVACLTGGGQNADLFYDTNAFNGRGGGGTTSNQSGQWQVRSGVHCVISVYDGAQLHQYIDGRLVAYTAATGSTTPTQLFVGSLNATPTFPWKGDIAELAIYNTALSQAQIDQLTRGWAYAYRLPLVNPF